MAWGPRSTAPTPPETRRSGARRHDSSATRTRPPRPEVMQWPAGGGRAAPTTLTSSDPASSLAGDERRLRGGPPTSAAPGGGSGTTRARVARASSPRRAEAGLLPWITTGRRRTAAPSSGADVVLPIGVWRSLASLASQFPVSTEVAAQPCSVRHSSARPVTPCTTIRFRQSWPPADRKAVSRYRREGPRGGVRCDLHSGRGRLSWGQSCAGADNQGADDRIRPPVKLTPAIPPEEDRRRPVPRRTTARPRNAILSLRADAGTRTPDPFITSPLFAGNSRVSWSV